MSLGHGGDRGSCGGLAPEQLSVSWVDGPCPLDISEPRKMIVECNNCDSKVDAEVLGSNDEYDPEMGEPYRYSLAKCPVCSSTLLGGQDHYQSGPDSWKWSDARRVWPEPDNFLHWTIPSEVRSALEEARKCYKAKAFSACAVMCGRAIEAICIQHTKEKNLAKGLKALKDKGIIDARLLEWSNSLRHERNLGAHATGIKTARDDARDLLDFAIAIGEYVFVLSAKYKEYKKRKDKAKKDKNVNGI